MSIVFKNCHFINRKYKNEIINSDKNNFINYLSLGLILFLLINMIKCVYRVEKFHKKYSLQYHNNKCYVREKFFY